MHSSRIYSHIDRDFTVIIGRYVLMGPNYLKDIELERMLKLDGMADDNGALGPWSNV